jgi:uncharacterized protein YqgV (UPF0045/DUF77 family)
MTRDTRPDERTEITTRRRGDDEPSVDSEPAADSGVSVSQVVAGALAAVTAAAVGSTLGVAGTFIGAAVASVIATVGSAFYSAWLRRGREVVLRTAKVGTQRLPVAVPVQRLRPRLADLPWKSMAAVTAASLLLGVAVLTAVEVVAGQRVGGDGGGGRTSVGELVGGGSQTRDRQQEDRSPQDGPSQEPQPSDDATEPEPTQEPEPTEEPTAEPTEEPSEEPTQEPTGEPTDEPTEEPAEAPTPTTPEG